MKFFHEFLINLLQKFLEEFLLQFFGVLSQKFLLDFSPIISSGIKLTNKFLMEITEKKNCLRRSTRNWKNLEKSPTEIPELTLTSTCISARNFWNNVERNSRKNLGTNSWKNMGTSVGIPERVRREIPDEIFAGIPGRVAGELQKKFMYKS